MLRGTERVRKTMRVQFLCGLRAVARARADYEALAGIAATLSASIDDVPALIESQATQLKDSDQARRKLEKELATHRIAAIFDEVTRDAPGPRCAFVNAAAATMDRLRLLGQAATEVPDGVFVGTTGEGNGLLVASAGTSAVDAAGKLIREALATVGGKGGGSQRLAQGTVPSAEQLRSAFTFIRESLTRGR